MPAGEYALLTVSDTGVGIAQDIQALIFEPFFTTKDPGKGTGLGLATVYGVVRQHGGHIVVDSTVGAGRAFRIYLPTAKDAAPLAEAPPPATVLPGRETVLLVEDQEEVRAVIR
jgi:two-component system cell cycle sensor histidine kinase/response regulator CckA